MPAAVLVRLLDNIERLGRFERRRKCRRAASPALILRAHRSRREAHTERHLISAILMTTAQKPRASS
jgi:hypothetical protein